MTIFSIAVPITLAVLKVAMIALVGFVLARRGLLHKSALADLSRLVVTITVPCLIFANIAAGVRGASLFSGLLCIVSAPIMLGIGLGTAFVLARLWRIGESHRRAVICAATFQNANYLPLAVATSVAAPLAGLFPSGSATTPAAITASGVVAISLFTTLYLPLFWGWGLRWLTAEPDAVRQPGAVSWQIIPPPVIGILVGYAFGLTPLHLALTPAAAPLHFLFEAIRDIGSVTIPLANLILGGMLAHVGEGRLVQWRDAATVIFVKLLLIPAVTLGLLYLLRHWWRHDAALAVAAFVVFLEAISPPATNLAVMAGRLPPGGTNRAGQIIPGLLLVNYSLALVSLPFWLTVFFHVLRRN